MISQRRSVSSTAITIGLKILYLGSLFAQLWFTNLFSYWFFSPNSFDIWITGTQDLFHQSALDQFLYKWIDHFSDNWWYRVGELFICVAILNNVVDRYYDIRDEIRRPYMLVIFVLLTIIGTGLLLNLILLGVSLLASNFGTISAIVGFIASIVGIVSALGSKK